jgi:predicted hydrolase (HD superfamily)
MSKIPTREEAYAILTEYTKTDSLIKHALSVEGVMRYYAKKLGHDVEYWGAVGLLHDLDYEMYPDIHCDKTPELLKNHGVDDEGFIRAILSHAYGMRTDVEPVHIMEKIIYTTDELTGLVTAAALMRPSRSVMDLEYSSLWKKYKNAKFAAGVDRSIIENGCAMWDADLKTVIEDVIQAMREIADSIDLGMETN